MKKKRALINQPMSWGDFMFCQGIAHQYMKRGFEITWPIIPKYLEDAKRHYPKIHWIKQNRSPYSLRLRVQGERNGYEILPIRYADSIIGVHPDRCMRAKYDMLGLNWEKWKNHAMWERDLVKESRLMEEVGAEGEYILLNMNYHRSGKRRPIELETDKKVIQMDYLQGYSMLDWGMVFQNASEIHTVSTSNLYLMEMLPLKAKELHLYKRPEEKNLKQVSYILKKAYILHS